VRSQIGGFLRKLRGEPVNIDAKKLRGGWKGFFRIRKGKLRIIFSLDTAGRSIYIERVDFRGDAYK
jgi:mRNA interferase RelE/StbE